MFFGCIRSCLVPYFRNKVQAANRYTLMNGKQTTAFLLASFCLLAGCSRKSHHDDALMPIRLATSLQARSAIDIFEDLPVALIAGRQVDDPGETWLGIADGGRITLTPPRYYPQDGSTLYLRGFYPPAEVESNCVHYDLTGSEDLMFAGVLAGSLSHPFDSGDRTLAFRHLLVQLNISLSPGENFPTEYRLKSVCINGSSSQATLSLPEGTLSFAGQCAPLFLYRAESHAEGCPLVPGQSVFPGCLLVQPGAALTIDLVFSRDDIPGNDLVINDIPVIFQGGSSETGAAYHVEIRLPVPLYLDAVLAEWTDGSNGAGGVVVPGTKE